VRPPWPRDYVNDGQNAVRVVSSLSGNIDIVSGLWLDDWFASTDSTGSVALLKSALGSTIALVNPASPGSQPPAVTYDPSGNPSSTSQGNSFPFLYQGMEREVTEPYPLYYSGAGGFHNPQIQRGFSLTGAQGTSFARPSA
jgi:hypothetical protein